MLKNILISKLFDLDLLDVALNNYTLNETQEKELETKLELLNSGSPLDYLVGKINILDLNLIVNEYTLIPREETEFWLQEFKNKIQINRHLGYNERSSANIGDISKGKRQNSLYQGGWGVLNDKTQIGDTVVAVTNSQTLIDLGAGTGIIGLYLSDVYDKVYLLDVDEKTLGVTNQNIELNQKTNCQSLLSDGINKIQKVLKQNEKWDLVANLPYLPSEDIPRAKECKVEHEPAIALYSGQDGLELFNKVLKQIQTMENKPINVIFELDPRNIRQAQINLNRLNYETEIWLDQNGLKRVLVGKSVS
jgi:methylase of polypeptide subunit release factors